MFEMEKGKLHWVPTLSEEDHVTSGDPRI